MDVHRNVLVGGGGEEWCGPGLTRGGLKGAGPDVRRRLRSLASAIAEAIEQRVTAQSDIHVLMDISRCELRRHGGRLGETRNALEYGDTVLR